MIATSHKESYQDAPVSGTGVHHDDKGDKTDKDHQSEATETVGKTGELGLDANVDEVHYEPSTPFIPFSPASPTLTQTGKVTLSPSLTALKVKNMRGWSNCILFD